MGERVCRIDMLGFVSQEEDKYWIDVSLSAPPLSGPATRRDHKTVPVAVGLLPFLRLGSQWQQGLPRQDTWATERVLHVNTHEVEHVTLGHAITDNYGNRTQLITGSNYRLWNTWFDVRDARCAFLRAEDGTPVLIPHTELLRFYYAQSEILTWHIVAGTLLQKSGRELLYDARATGGAEDGLYRIHLNETVPDEDAWILARLAASEYAMEQAKLTGTSLSLNVRRGKKRPVFADFPFQDVTDLRARTRRLRSGGVTFYLVLQILSCSGPMPFRNIRILGKPHIRKTSTEETPVPGDSIGGPFVGGGGVTGVESVSRPGRRAATRIEVDHDHTRFLPVADQVAELADRYITLPGTKGKPGEGEVTGGEGLAGVHPPGNPGDGTRPVRIEPKASLPRMSPDLKNAARALRILSKDRGRKEEDNEYFDANVRYRRVNAEDLTSELYPKLIRKLSAFPLIEAGEYTLKKGDKEISGNWSILTPGRVRRMALIAEIRFEGQYFYFCEHARTAAEKAAIRGRMPVVAFPEGKEADDTELEALMVNCVKNRGVWLKPLQWNKDRFRLMNHAYNTPENLRRRLKGHIKDLKRALSKIPPPTS